MNNIFNPKVSIIIPVYNGGEFVKEAIECAINQTYTNIEVIVVNDGSNDKGETEAIVKSYGERIRYYRKENGGVSSALNYGIREMTGEYFSWLSHDDKYTLDKIEKQIDELSHLENHEVICLCESRQIDKDSKLMKGRHRDVFKSAGLYSWEKVLMNLLKRGTFNGCALLIPKKVFNVCGCFDETLRYNQDSLMWIRICLAKFNFLYSKKIGSYIRIHDGQLTQRGRDLFHKDCEKMSEELVPKLASISASQVDFLYAYALYNAKYATFLVVDKCLCEAKANAKFSPQKVIKIKVMSMYGKIRPAIRKLYYKIVKRVKTQ